MTTRTRDVPARPVDPFALTAPALSGRGQSTDVTECDQEPIHIPGSVQPHGALLCLDAGTLTIERASANAAEFLGSAPEALLGEPLSRAVGAGVAAEIGRLLALSSSGRVGPLVEPLPGTVEGRARVRTCDLTLHRADPEQVLLEVESHQPSAALGPGDIPAALLRLQSAPDLSALMQQAVEEVASITGFDRVMFYRFNAEGDGEVVAERVTAGQEAYLGLHYPGSDIPRQARELYRRQWLRLIVDTSYDPAPILPPDQPDFRPLDLSFAALRSVSPVHLQYLRNMGVAASMSMSVVVDDDLWGLILCHARARHLVPSAMRTACEQLAQFVSGQISDRWVTTRLAADLHQQQLRAAMMDQVENPLPALGLVGDYSLLDAVAAEGAAGRIAGQTVVSGDLLEPDLADGVASLLRQHADSDGAFRSSCLSRDAPEVAEFLRAHGVDGAAGALLAARPPAGSAGGRPSADAPVGSAGSTPSAGAVADYLLWVRREVEQTVDWAGEPTVKHQSGSLSPRASFALWREKVRDQSQPWLPGDVQAAASLADAVEARLRRLTEVELAAAAVRNQELFQREHEIADTLQRGMLPVLPELAGLTLSASYVTASETAEVGGDWYDVFTLPDGSIGIAMGDVTGHDLSAAAAMGQLRSVLRSYAWEESSPAIVLDKLDAFVSGFAMRHLATLFFARLERPSEGAAGEIRLRWANAGHPPPLLRLPDGTVELIEDGLSVLIGVGLGIEHEAATRVIPPGSLLLLYTDGLVERRDRDVGVGVDQLADVVAHGPQQADELREYVLDRMVPGHREDDIAVLVVQVHP